MTASESDLFLNQVARGDGLWQSIDFRCIAVSKGGSWYNLLTRAYLSATPVNKVVRFRELPETDRIAAHHVVFPAKELQGILRGIEDGVLELNGRKTYYLYQDAHRPGPPAHYTPHYHLSDITAAYEPSYPYWSAHALTYHAATLADLQRGFDFIRTEVDNALQLHRTPYDGLQGLARSFAGYTGTLESNRILGAELFAPIEAILVPDECYIEGSRVNYTIRAGSRAAAQETDIGFTAVGTNPLPHAGRVKIPRSKWVKKHGLYRAQGTFSISQELVVTLMLRTSAFFVQRLQLTARASSALNVRTAVYDSVDPQFRVLTDWLASGKGQNRSEDFERAVARVFHLIGFSVDLFGGGKGLTDACDLVAYDDATPAVIAVECTTGPLEASGKRGKLALRLAVLKDRCSDREVIGVLATSLPAAAISPSDREAARNDGLVVLSREDLNEALDVAAGGAKAPQIIDLLVARSDARYDDILRQRRLTTG